MFRAIIILYSKTYRYCLFNLFSSLTGYFCHRFSSKFINPCVNQLLISLKYKISFYRFVLKGLPRGQKHIPVSKFHHLQQIIFPLISLLLRFYCQKHGSQITAKNKSSFGIMVGWLVHICLTPRKSRRFVAGRPHAAH